MVQYLIIFSIYRSSYYGSAELFRLPSDTGLITERSQSVQIQTMGCPPAPHSEGSGDPVYHQLLNGSTAHPNVGVYTLCRTRC